MEKMMSAHQLTDTAGQAVRFAFGKLPTYWKLATIRCCIYAFIVGVSAFNAGVEGYDSFSDMTHMEILKLVFNIFVAMAGVWVAFLDQSMTKVNDITTSSLTVTETHTEPKPISPDSPADKPKA